MPFQFKVAIGPNTRRYFDDIAHLRITIFKEYPYLYLGTLVYEREYLEAYAESPRSFVLIVEHEGRIVGASTGLPMSDTEESIQGPMRQHGYNPETIYYSGETLLLPGYREHGLGKLIFAQVEQYAQQIGVEWVSFLTVIRPPDHPLRPVNYREPDSLWLSNGCQKLAGLTTTMRWRDIDQKDETDHQLQYWLKKIQTR